MFGSTARGAGAYAKIGVETGVASASPHQLIVMLFDGALISLAYAQQHMKAGNISEKGRTISKTIDIIENGLRASLNLEAGGDIAVSLDSLYSYMSNRLVEANLKNEIVVLEEIHRLLSDLKGAWDAIRPRSSSMTVSPQLTVPPRIQTDMLTPVSTTLAKA